MTGATELVGRETIEILGGLRLEILLSSSASGGTCCVFVETTPPGGGPPPHKHLREEEVFTVLEGDYEFYREGGWTPMEVGVSILSQRGTYHAFRNYGDRPGRIMLMTNGGGIDDYFRSIAPLRLPDDAALFDEISKRHGYVFLPPS